MTKAPFDITHYFSSDVGFTNIVVRCTGQSGVEMKYGVPTVRGQCHLKEKHFAFHYCTRMLYFDHSVLIVLYLGYPVLTMNILTTLY